MTSSPQVAAGGPDPSWNDLYKAGGISALIVGALYAAATILLFAVPLQPTSGGAATLQYIASNRSAYILEQLLYNGPAIPGMIAFLALYPALRHLNKGYAAIGAVLGIASEALSLMIFDKVAALLTLSDKYAGAATDSGRETFATAAESLVAQTNIAFAVGVLTAIGILVLSVVMLKGVFQRNIAYLGMAAGVAGIICEGLRTVIGAGYIIYGLLLIIWFVVIGWKLHGLAKD